MKQERKTGFLSKLNLLDWVIIVIVIAVIGGAYYGLNHRYKGMETIQTHISYDLEIKAVSSAFTDNVKVGDLIKESTRGNRMGQVTKVSTSPAVSINEDMISGKFIAAVVPDMYDVIMTIDTNASVTAKDVVTDGLAIKVGKKVFIKGKGYANTAFVVAIRLNK